MKVWLAWLCLWVVAPFAARATVQEPAPAPAQAKAPPVECPTCKGKGKALARCAACDGAGSVPCSICAPKLSGFDLLHYVELDETSDDEVCIEVRDAARSASEVYGEVQRSMHGVAERGRAICPALCHKGKPLSRTEPCKYCGGKGSVACAPCSKKGSFRCARCDGKRQVSLACRDCGGDGLLPDPAAIPAERRDACSWCSEGAVACGDCGHGTVRAPCRVCNGGTASACRRCIGSGSAPCMRCSATGIHLSMTSLPPTATPCNECGQSGRIPCGECVKGTAKCKACDGAGKAAAIGCATCIGDRKRACAGCFRGSFRHWEVAGELLAKSDADAALAFLEIARSRVATWHERRARILATTDEERKELEKERSAAEKRLDSRMTALRKAQ